MSSKNPIKVGDVVKVKRGDGWLEGTVIKTVLARCHIQIDDRVYVEDWHTCRRVLTPER